MEDLPEQLHLAAVPAEVFGQRDPTAPKKGRAGEIDRLGGCRIAAQQERDAAGVAQGKLAIGPLEADAALGQAVQAGRLHQRIAIAVDAAVQLSMAMKSTLGRPWGTAAATGEKRATASNNTEQSTRACFMEAILTAGGANRAAVQPLRMPGSNVKRCQPEPDSTTPLRKGKTMACRISDSASRPIRGRRESRKGVWRRALGSSPEERVAWGEFRATSFGLPAGKGGGPPRPRWGRHPQAGA